MGGGAERGSCVILVPAESHNGVGGGTSLRIDSCCVAGEGSSHVYAHVVPAFAGMVGGEPVAAAFEVDQVLITSPDPDRPARTELSAAQRYRLVDGAIEPIVE